MEEGRIRTGEGGEEEEEAKGFYEIEDEEEEDINNNTNNRGEAGEEEEEKEEEEEGTLMEKGGPIVVMVCGSLIYYHCCMREGETRSVISLISDVFIVLLSSLAILGVLFRQINIEVPVDPVEWQISQETANRMAACLANTLGAAESVFRVAATGHDKRLFFKVVSVLYLLSAIGRSASGATVAYAGLCLFCLYVFAQSFFTTSKFNSLTYVRRECLVSGTQQDAMIREPTTISRRPELVLMFRLLGES